MKRGTLYYCLHLYIIEHKLLSKTSSHLMYNILCVCHQHRNSTMNFVEGYTNKNDFIVLTLEFRLVNTWWTNIEFYICSIHTKKKLLDTKYLLFHVLHIHITIYVVFQIKLLVLENDYIFLQLLFLWCFRAGWWTLNFIFILISWQVGTFNFYVVRL